MKIYTRTGDAGTTSLVSGGRVSKDHRRIEAYGTLDELSSVIGLLQAEPIPRDAAAHLVEIQEALLALGTALADPEAKLGSGTSPWDPRALEAWIDEMESDLEPLKAFILPGGSRAAGVTHLARVVCRRAERRAVAVAHEEPVPDGALAYLNRLSDTLFVLARWLNHRLGIKEQTWAGIRADRMG
ncbi:MAG: cob(I)yrinic acid a,c-diamide adenosyltransferase [Acidobacteria bacterium]|nr:cob(I)yrinic acid a,c-diamide adenosyltransferase [Acidobacteriota bacterium]